MSNTMLEICQETSEIALFNKIGEYATSKEYDVVYFKSKLPKLVTIESSYEMQYKYMHYIHVLENNEFILSIYYDKYNIGALYPESPYYELYDGSDVDRFLETDDHEMDLLDKVKELL